MDGIADSGSWRDMEPVRGQNGLYLGIDFGGTVTKVGLVSGDGIVLAKASVPTLELGTEQECDEFARKLMVFSHDALLNDGNDWSFDVSYIGIAVPGVVKSGKTAMLPNMTLDLDLLLKSITERFPWAKIRCINDANAAAIGEMWHGAGAGARNLVMVMLGTGVGAGVVVDGHVLIGANGAAGEFGHFNVDSSEDARPCGCGKRGCLEQYASGRGIVKSYLEERARANVVDAARDAQITAVDVFVAYEAGDPCAVAAVDTLVQTLGRALAQVAALFDPEVILIGGGVAGSAHHFLPALREVFAKHCIAPCAGTRIEAARHNQTAGIIGAVRYARDFD